MRIGIMGAGAIGCVVGGLLTEAGQDVTFLDQWPAHVEAMKQHGLRLTGTCGDRVVRVQALHLYEAQAIQQPFEAVFLSVKGYDTDWAALFAARLLRQPDGYMVVFQNGLNDERVARLVGRERTLGCVITIRAGLYEPGVAERTDQAPVGFTVGELEGPPTERVQRLVEVLNAVIPSRATPNLAGERWSKLAVNCLANPLAGLSGYSTADVLIEPAPRAIAIQVAAEVIRVARAAGHEVEPIFSIEPQRYVDAAEGRGLDQLEADLIAHGQGRPGGRPSLLQDVLKSRRTEINYLNGVVVAEGQRLGVPTPINAAVVREFERHGAGRLAPDPRNLDPLQALLAVTA
jgi:2-dehydropantoate 2-reductase